MSNNNSHTNGSSATRQNTSAHQSVIENDQSLSSRSENLQSRTQEQSQAVQPNSFNINPGVVAPDSSGGATNPKLPLNDYDGPISDQHLKHSSDNHKDRRKMRWGLFSVGLLASIGFLVTGAIMSYLIISNMLSTNEFIREGVNTIITNTSPEKTKEIILQLAPNPPESLVHAHDAAKEVLIQTRTQQQDLLGKFLESTNWTSISPMITLVAFILGVGLTLAIALLRALFREDQAEKTNPLSDVASPLSKLIENFIDLIMSKFRK
ncbi:hypothetical protein [Dickeya dadantii]|uniref:hypothetical protein n=1 Tax=Dickeya dadantii TaxID=204038 RepID=UPI000A4DE063|nr:hypothetical protein [Dickeya dadantii]